MAKLKETLHNPNIECIITGDKDEATAPTNAFYLSRVIGNLLSNSAKFTESGTITVTCNIEKEKRQLVISVTDTGIGIPADQQDRVFERFYRVDKSHSKASGGTGLGLSIVKHAVQYHHGVIELKSELGKGTEIRVTFPVKA